MAIKELPEDYTNYGFADLFENWPEPVTKCRITHANQRDRVWMNVEKTVERVSCHKCKYFYYQRWV